MLQTTDQPGKTLTDEDRERLRAAAEFHRRRLGIGQQSTRRGFLVIVASIWPAFRSGGRCQ